MTATREIYRFAFVYVLLFLLMILGSNGVFGATQTAQLSLETFSRQAPISGLPVFGQYYYDPGFFKGDYTAAASQIDSLVKARQDLIEKARLHERNELNRLRAEHRSLMWNADEKGGEHSKWSVAMYSNISQQTLLKQTTDNQIGAWDTKNHLLVHSTEKDGKRYIVDLKVIREPSKGKRSAVASLP